MPRRRILRRTPALATALAASVLIAATACAAIHAGSGSKPSIEYTLVPTPSTADQDGRTRVRVTLDGIASGTSSVRFQMPVWTPGEYRVQNHGQSVRGFRVVGRTASASRPDPHTWVVPTDGRQSLTIEYDVINASPGVFTENVDVRSTRAFYNGAATFAFVTGRTDEPVSLAVSVPRGWRGPITTLRPWTDTGSAEAGVGDRVRSAAAVRASSYDELADTPVLIGEADVRTFHEQGRAHSTVLFGRRSREADAHRDTFRAIARAGREYMGSWPYESYTFFIDWGGRGGGLEHANGARIAWLGRTKLARFMAHEYFHLWNVKRIRPAVLGPFDYIKPPKTRNFWFCEGVTEYVAGLLVLRAGLLDERAYLNDLALSVTRLANTRARLHVTAEEASLGIWEDGTSTGYRGLSVYLKGEIIGLCLDLELLRITGGRYGLRELMRDLMDRYAPPKPGYPEDGLRQAVILAGGESMGPFYDRLCRTTQELPVAQCLRAAGFRLEGDASGGFRITRDLTVSGEARRIAQAWLYGR